MAFSVVVLLICGLVPFTTGSHIPKPSKVKTFDGCKGGVITSPNYPKKYSPNLCVGWRIRVPNHSRVKLTFSYFNVEPEANCKYDYLIMNGIDPPGKRYCGDFSKHKGLNMVFLSTSETVDITFYTDKLVQKKGFRMIFEPEICCMNPCGPHGLCKPKPYTKTCEFSCCLKHKHEKKCEKPNIIEPAPPVIHGGKVKLICNSSHGDDGNHTYVWKKNGQVIPGENARVLKVLALLINVNDTYVCLVLLADSSSDPSDPVDVEVKPPKPSVEGKTNLTDGDSTTLNCVSPVNASQYVWYRNGVILLGQTNETLVLSVGLTDDGSRYQCKIKVGQALSDPSDPVTLYVVPKKPDIKILPDNDVLHGEWFTVRCIDQSNVSNPVYVFYIDGVSQTPSNSSTLLQQANINNIHEYSCAVSADAGVDFSEQSDIVKPIVRVHKPYVVGNTNLTDGDSTVLKCVSPHASSSSEYKWYKDDQKLYGETSQTLYLYNVSLPQDGQRYRCKIKVGQTVSDPSDPVTLTVVPKKPKIKIRPDNDVLHGEWFTVKCIDQSNVSNPVYVFYIDGVSQTPSNSSTLLQQANINNIHEYSCAVSADAGVDFSEQSDIVKPIVRVHKPYVVGNTNLTDGDSTVLKCVSPHASSSSEYKWYKDDQKLYGETSQTLYLYNVSLPQDGQRYRCKIKVGQTVSDPSDPVTLTVVPKKPDIKILPDKDVLHGEWFTVKCIDQSNVSNPVYVFYIDGVSQTPSNSSTLLQQANINNIHEYSCAVSADAGVDFSEQSDIVKPTVIPLEPIVIGDPTHTDGDITTLICNASSTGTYFQWYYNGEPIPGETSSTLNVTMDLAKDGSNYTCTVAVDEDEPSDPSDPLQVSVVPKKPSIRIQPDNVLVDGESFSVICIDQSNVSSPLYVFYIDGVSQVPSSNNILDQEADINNIHEYSCAVSADGGNDFSEQSDIVKPKVVPKKPKIKIRPDNDVLHGEWFTVKCIDQSNVSNPVYVFYIDGVSQTPSNSSTLLQQANINNIHNYSCAVSADGGVDFSEQSVVIKPRVCPHPECSPPCKPGLTYEHVYVSPSGCRICEIKPCPTVHCPTNCPTDRVVHETDRNGCKKCSCYPYHCKDPVCPTSCPEGVDWEYDDHGCKLCVCKKTSAICLKRSLICNLTFDFQSTFAINACKEPVCPTCSHGTILKHHDNGCKYCACKDDCGEPYRCAIQINTANAAA